MCFDALIRLPPTLNSFDIVGSLLRDKTPMTLGTTGVLTTVGEAVKSETLGYFLHECISWLDKAEVEEREGLVNEDIFAKGVQNVGSFFPQTSNVTNPLGFVVLPVLLLTDQAVHSESRSSKRNRHCRDDPFHASQLSVRRRHRVV